MTALSEIETDEDEERERIEAEIEAKAAENYERDHWMEQPETGSWSGAIDNQLYVRVEAYREKARKELGL